MVLNKDKMDKPLLISFEIKNKIETGIYECDPIGDNSYSYPIWIVSTFDFTELNDEDLLGLKLYKITEKEEYVSNISKEGKNKDKAIFVIPKTVFIELSNDPDPYYSLGHNAPSGEFTDNESKPFVANEIHEKVKEYENTNTTPTKSTRVDVPPPLLRKKRPRDPSSDPDGRSKNDYYKKNRDRLKGMMNYIAASYDPTQPITPQIASPFKKKKSLKKKSLKKKKSKSKKSLKKKKSKSKNSLKK